MLACQASFDTNEEVKEGLFPHEYDDSELELLKNLGLERNTLIVDFEAPIEAITLNINIYTLANDLSWHVIGASGISLGEDRDVMDYLSGNISLLLKEDYAIDCHINSGGRVKFQTEKILLEDEINASGVLFLENKKKIELEKEIPIALMVYNSDSSLHRMTLDYYYEPESLSHYELVQVVTMTFTKEKL
ncbi:hypothetical protein EZV73_01755 [Acidaminobacter sp. JC074]|uniref:hypothetical protein n=1 Tax=Acidaminobacter sp. JC074 TaxID=2530199 RepID=UPI001F0D8FEF|nr:hypothetical protein [Acidaminobacter sp. JC074]MCH4886270.1 hypothetical protein [Acidaminobacter sp. JC074]